MEVLKHKVFVANKKVCNVKLIQDGLDYIVSVDGVEYKKFANQLFAVQLFNAI